MKVFRIQFGINNYQYFLADDANDSVKLYMRDCQPLADSWVPPKVFVQYPRAKKSDFFQSNSSILIVNEKARDALNSHLAFAGELLPLPYNDEMYFILNVTECIDALDRERSEIQFGDVRRPVFRPDRFTESTLFKVPEDDLRIYVREGESDFDMEFRQAVEAAGLQGLRFVEVWSDEP